MDFKGADVVGLKVISFRDNSELGVVKDIIYSPKQNKVVAFLVDEGNNMVESRVIPIKEIKELTKDELVVKSEKSLRSASEVVRPIEEMEKEDSFLKGSKIISEKGDELGMENDIVFDSKKGKVKKFEVIQKNKKKQIPVDKVIGSNDATIVKTKSEKSGLVEKISKILSG